MAGNGLFEVPQQVALALTLASNATGADFDYLMKTAARESNFRPAAAARTSSARGLFQFIEETWLRTIKEQGAKYGLKELSGQIFRTRSGRYYVPNATARRRILKLRHDPGVSALMAGAFTRSNAERIAQRIGREPTDGELYLAHFLGPGDAIRMIKLKRSNPHWRADRAFPRAAKSNRSIFYDRKRPRSVREVYWRLVENYKRAGKSTRTSWSTHIVRVDPEALARRPTVAVQRLAAGKRAAPKGVVPLPFLKQAPNLDVSVVQVADAGGTPDPIGDLLRGSIVLFHPRTEPANATLLTLN